MNFKHLRSFCVVAEEGHVTRAAKRLNLAQPALTQQIKSLEAELGSALLRRTGRGIEITAAGRYLQKEAEQLLAQVRAVSEATRLVEGRAGRTITLAISDVETLAGPITEHLRRYRHNNSHVVLSEIILEPREIAAALRDGQIDAAVSCAAVPDRHDLVRHRLGCSPVLLAVPKSHDLASKQGVSFEEVLRHPLVLVAHGEVPGSFEAKLRQVSAQRGFMPHLFTVTPCILIALNMVASDAGLALLPQGVEGLRTDAITYLPLLDAPELVVEFALYYRRKERSRDILALRANED